MLNAECRVRKSKKKWLCEMPANAQMQTCAPTERSRKMILRNLRFGCTTISSSTGSFLVTDSSPTSGSEEATHLRPFHRVRSAAGRKGERVVHPAAQPASQPASQQAPHHIISSSRSIIISIRFRFRRPLAPTTPQRPPPGVRCPCVCVCVRA